MKDFRLFLSLIFLGIFLTFGFLAFNQYRSQKPVVEGVTANPPTPTPLDQQTLLSAGSGQTRFFHRCDKGQTPVESLATNVGANNVEITETSYGKVITKINGISAENGKYWTYLIDTKESTISASEFRCNGVEEISWELK